MSISKLPIITLIALVSIASAHAQNDNTQPSLAEKPASTSFFKSNNVFNKLDLGVTLGSTGIGFELASPVTEWAKVRVGASFVPSFTVPLHFGITAYTDANGGVGNYEKIRDTMYKISGFEMDDQIDVDCKPTMAQFKFLVDLYPLRNNRHWHLTLGFFAGSKSIAKAINTMTEMPSLLAIGMYNRMYDYAMEDGFIENPIYKDIYLDPEQADMLKEKLESYGRIGIHIGDYKNGTPYYMEPDKDGTVSAKAFVNTFRYFTGVGYSTSLSADHRWNLAVDAGAMFWGGSPNVINHEGVSMSHDLTNVRGKVGDYLDLMNSLKVYPVLELKVSYTLF